MINMVKLPTSKSELFLRVAKGHFATSHSHINYYIDVTTQKTRLSEAKAVAKELVSAYQHSTIVDTVLCLDGTQVIGTCLANELTKDIHHHRLHHSGSRGSRELLRRHRGRAFGYFCHHPRVLGLPGHLHL